MARPLRRGDPGRNRDNGDPAHLPVESQRAGQTRLDRPARARLRGPPRRRRRAPGAPGRDREPAGQGRFDHGVLLESAREDEGHALRPLHPDGGQVLPGRRWLFLVLRPLGRHAEGGRDLGLAGRGGEHAHRARIRSRGRGGGPRGHGQAREAEGLRRPEGRVQRLARARGGSQDVRQGQDRSVQVPSVDRVRLRAAEDRDGEDPALQAPRMTAFYDRGLETLDPEALRAHQWTRFAGLARGILPRNKFITEKWRAEGVESPDDLQRWSDFFRLPLIRKGELVDDQAAHPPFGTNVTFPLDRYVRVHQTSGTTGVPIRWLDTQQSWDWWARCWGFVLRGAGLGPGDRVFFPFS